MKTPRHQYRTRDGGFHERYRDATGAGQRPAGHECKEGQWQPPRRGTTQPASPEAYGSHRQQVIQAQKRMGQALHPAGSLRAESVGVCQRRAGDEQTKAPENRTGCECFHDVLPLRNSLKHGRRHVPGAWACAAEARRPRTSECPRPLLRGLCRCSPSQYGHAVIEASLSRVPRWLPGPTYTMTTPGTLPALPIPDAGCAYPEPPR